MMRMTFLRRATLAFYIPLLAACGMSKKVDGILLAERTAPYEWQNFVPHTAAGDKYAQLNFGTSFELDAEVFRGVKQTKFLATGNYIIVPTPNAGKIYVQPFNYSSIDNEKKVLENKYKNISWYIIENNMMDMCQSSSESRGINCLFPLDVSRAHKQIYFPQAENNIIKGFFSEPRESIDGIHCDEMLCAQMENGLVYVFSRKINIRNVKYIGWSERSGSLENIIIVFRNDGSNIKNTLILARRIP